MDWTWKAQTAVGTLQWDTAIFDSTHWSCRNVQIGPCRFYWS
jgi:hypothetical protein